MPIQPAQQEADLLGEPQLRLTYIAGQLNVRQARIALPVVSTR